MKQIFLAFTVIAAFLIPANGHLVAVNKIHAQLTFFSPAGKALCCDKTTEVGEDEIYFIVRVEGRRTSVPYLRLPGNYPNEERGHWNMNDGKDKYNHCVQPGTIAEVDLAYGESAKVIVYVMEEDGGSLEKIAKNLGITVPVNITDTDDYIGSFAATLRNTGGYLAVSWQAIDRITSEIPNINGPNTHEFRMGGDGSNYVGWLKAE